jgi:hypothetical protein
MRGGSFEVYQSSKQKKIPVTDSSVEFQCDNNPVEEVVMEHAGKSIFPAWVLFLADTIP